MKYFTVAELACPCCGQAEFEDLLFPEWLDALREEFGKPMIVNSGYRCAKHDAEVGGKGPHQYGAADIRVFGPDAYRLLDCALVMGATGIGLKQHGPHAGRYMHIDRVRSEGHPRPRIWTYP